MMDIFDQILDSLELERELGVRAVEIDRALLVPPATTPPAPSHADVAAAPAPSHAEAPSRVSGPKVRERATVETEACDILFLTGRPLSAAGMDIFAKMSAALVKMKPDLKVVLNGSGAAKTIVFLGSAALREKLPSVRPVRGSWMDVGGVPAVVTYSPDYILTHFQPDSPNMKKAKQELWNTVKSIVEKSS